jgi:hypothetical protein
MTRILLNDAFHRLIARGLLPEKAWLTFVKALESGALRLWCNDAPPLALDYIVNGLHIGIHDGRVEVLPAGPLGWEAPPSAYVFKVDREEFERLPTEQHDFNRSDLRRLALATAQRWNREGVTVNGSMLHRWLTGYCESRNLGRNYMLSARRVRGWLQEWREAGELQERRR